VTQPDPTAEVAKHVTRAIFALKSPPPPGSQHYRSGWDDGLEAAMDAARDALAAVLPASVDRADVLRWAADHLARQADELWVPGTKAHTVMHADAAELRRVAAETRNTTDQTGRLERGREQLIEAMSAVSEDRTCCGWASDWARTLHAEGGIWEALGRAVGWPVGNYDQWVWVSWDEAAALYATPPAGGAPQPKEA
jgi:hypothetical protein